MKITGFVFAIRLKNDKKISYISYSYATSLGGIRAAFKKQFDEDIKFDEFILDAFEVEVDPSLPDKRQNFIKKIYGRKHADHYILEYNPIYNSSIKTLSEKTEDDMNLHIRLEAMKNGKRKKEKELLKRFKTLYKTEKRHASTASNNSYDDSESLCSLENEITHDLDSPCSSVAAHTK